MFNLKRMAQVAWDGLDDMLPALKQALRERRDDPMLRHAYGPRPQWALLAIALICLIAGELFAHFGPSLPFKDYVSWPAVALGLSVAAIWRRYLFGADHSADDGDASRFTLLAASLIPAIGLVLLGIAVLGDAGSSLAWGHEPETVAGRIALMVTGLVAVAAALTIAIASLAYSRSWGKALADLALRLLVFRITVWVTTLVIIEIGWIGQLIGLLVSSFLDITIPEWLPGLIDELSYAIILMLLFLAVIGGTWTVCRDSFTELLARGNVNILKRLQAILDDKDEDEGDDNPKGPGRNKPKPAAGGGQGRAEGVESGSAVESDSAAGSS